MDRLHLSPFPWNDHIRRPELSTFPCPHANNGIISPEPLGWGKQRLSTLGMPGRDWEPHRHRHITASWASLGPHFTDKKVEAQRDNLLEVIPHLRVMHRGKICLVPKSIFLHSVLPLKISPTQFSKLTPPTIPDPSTLNSDCKNYKESRPYRRQVLFIVPYVLTCNLHNIPVR